MECISNKTEIIITNCSSSYIALRNFILLQYNIYFVFQKQIGYSLIQSWIHFSNITPADRLKGDISTYMMFSASARLTSYRSTTYHQSRAMIYMQAIHLIVILQPAWMLKRIFVMKYIIAYIIWCYKMQLYKTMHYVYSCHDYVYSDWTKCACVLPCIYWYHASNG